MNGPKQQIGESGVWIAEAILSGSECDRLVTEFSNTYTKRGRAGGRHLMSNPAVAAIAEDPRLLAFARSELGPEAVPYRAGLFEKSARANWLVVSHLVASKSGHNPYSNVYLFMSVGLLQLRVFGLAPGEN
jgi:hypothetical protein